MQDQESKEMTPVFGKLVGILKNKNFNPPAVPVPAHTPSYTYQSQDLTYAGVGGRPQNVHVYDMSHSYLQFHEL